MYGLNHRVTRSRHILIGAAAVLAVGGVTLVQPASAAGHATDGDPVIAEAFEADAGGFEVVSGGTWEVVDGEYVLSAPASGPIVGNLSVHQTAIVGDFSLSVDLAVTQTSADWDDAAVVFGYVDLDNYYMVSFNESNDDATNGVFRVSGGVATELADFATTVPSGVQHHVELTVVDGVAAASVNGELLGSATLDADPLIGRVGLGSRNDGVAFDNVVVHGTPYADSEPPDAPSGLTVELPYPTEAELRWQPSSDDIGVQGYRVYRDGAEVADVATTAFSDSDLSPDTTYTYAVRAYDFAGNLSGESEPLVVTTLPPDTSPPTRPTDVSAVAPNGSQVTLTWKASEDDYGVVGYQIYRADRRGAALPHMEVIATVTETTFTDSGLRPDTRYTYRVRALDRAGNVSRPTSPAKARTGGRPATVPYEQEVIDSAVAEPLAAFTLNHETRSENIRGATAMYFLTTAATYAPDHHSSSSVPVADRVVEHVHNLINVPGNEPGCSGGLDTTGINLAMHSFALARTVPEIWDQLSDADQDKITLLVQACLVASHWLHDDDNDFDTGINQLGNTNKNWNPNHVEGGVGMGLAASYYLGAAEANEFLQSFDAVSFRQRLADAGFTSTQWVFSQTSAAELEAATRDEFTYRGHPLTEPWDWIEHRAAITYSRTVAPTGAAGLGYVVSGAEDLPNVGELGMATEFESSDGEGPRSDIRYVSLGWNNSVANLWLVDYFGHRPSEGADTSLRRYTVGTTDFLYKAERGYRSYSLGIDRGVYTDADLHQAMGYDWLRELWRSKAADFERDAGDPGEPPPSDVLPAAADAFVRGGVYADDNFGSSTSLMVKTDPNLDFHREALIKFDLSQVTGELAGAVLAVQARISDAAGEAIDIEVYATGSDWAEDTVTWNTRPELGAHLGSVHVVSEPATYEVDLTDYVLGQLAAGKDEVSIAIRQDPPSGRGLATFLTSRLDPGNGPRLQLAFSDQE